MGLISTNGTILGQQSIIVKPKKSYASISHRLNVNEKEEEVNQNKTLQDIIATMKVEKEGVKVTTVIGKL